MVKAPGCFGSGKPHSMGRFLEICLLVLLAGGQGHGYGFMDRLSLFGFSQEELNGSTLYRTLRKMEQEGWVTSKWESGCQGPKKRIYDLTGRGREELDDWISILKERKQRIENLIACHEKLEGKRKGNGNEYKESANDL